MMPEAGTLLVAAALTASGTAGIPTSSMAWPPPIASAAPKYLLLERAVDNWRSEGSRALDLEPVAAIRLALDRDPASTPTPRCVKLNNYWCIKRGGWGGEIAADGEGHVAFATADDGAAVAAQLLRRYYIDFKRRSARAIVSRWAPARCGFLETRLRAAPSKPTPEPPRKPDSLADAKAARAAKATASVAPPQRAERSEPGQGRMMPQRVVPMGLAPYGLENTLRARWLAAHGRGGVVSPPRARQARDRPSRPPRSSLALEPAPAIAVGMGEPVRDRSADSSPLLDSCVLEQARVANYAARAIVGVAAGPDDDLALFSADGAPTENLAKVMANMAAVEIGPLRASNAIIAAGIARMTRLLSAGKSAASASAPVADNATGIRP